MGCGASAPELKPVDTGKAPIPKVSSEEMEKINAMIKAKGTVNPHKEATFQRKFHNRGAVHGERHEKRRFHVGDSNSSHVRNSEVERIRGFVATRAAETAAKMSRTAAELRRSMTGGRSSMRMSVAENRKSGVDGAYHVEKPRHHHVHMPHVHMPHVHMPHVHMPHLHNPFHRKTHHDGEYDGEHDDDAHPKKVQRSKTFLQRMTSGMRSSTRASRVSRQASEDKETNLFPDAPSVNEEQVMPGAASSIRKSAQSPSAASATPVERTGSAVTDIEKEPSNAHVNITPPSASEDPRSSSVLV